MKQRKNESVIWLKEILLSRHKMLSFSKQVWKYMNLVVLFLFFLYKSICSFLPKKYKKKTKNLMVTHAVVLVLLAFQSFFMVGIPVFCLILFVFLYLFEPKHLVILQKDTLVKINEIEILDKTKLTGYNYPLPSV